MEHSQGPTLRSKIEHMGADSSRCGYCRSEKSSHNYGVWAHRLDVKDYQDLLDAGWRRSGNYLYRPNLRTTCCPTYVIRLEAQRFRPSTTHKRVLKRLRRCSNPPQETDSVQPTVAPSLPNSISYEHERGIVINAIRSTLLSMKQKTSSSLPQLDDRQLQSLIEHVKVFPPKPRVSKKKGAAQIAGPASNPIPSTDKKLPHLSSNVALVLAAAERRKAVQGAGHPKQNAAKQDLLHRQMNIAQCFMESLKDSLSSIGTISVSEPGFLNFWFSEAKAETEKSLSDDEQVEMEDVQAASLPDRPVERTKRPGTRLSSSLYRSLALSEVSEAECAGNPSVSSQGKSQHVGEATKPHKRKTTSVRNFRQSGESNMTDITDDSAFSMELVPSQFEWEAYEMFRKYQMTVHREQPSQCGEDTYRSFLVDSPLVRTRSNANPNHSYGSFHMLYRLSGRLFAVGVVDVLPRCLSSVYLFYDPDFAKLSPGTLSALKEIEWVKGATINFPALQFYYMGFYIHSCPKMRYKAGFYPSELLCESTKNWIPAVDALKVLNTSGQRCLRLAPPEMPPAKEADNFNLPDNEVDTLANESKVQLSFGREGTRVVTLSTLQKIIKIGALGQFEVIRERLRFFVRLVGKVSSRFYTHIL